ncbi:hypothetical protein BDV93DRAFT_512672 [Ceratobasidium sp. AG-I]|nr:hypothetical protein BDV93DRAFT_512672 [Ceratobasidium sp. AG-I]
MPKEVKKRTRVASGGPSTMKKTHPVESDDAKALRKLFKQSTPNAIANTISNSFKSGPPEHLRVLREILGPLFEAASPSLHCVRCHTEYVQSGNHKNACVIMCDDDAEFTHDYHNGSEGYYTKFCCEETWREGEEPDDDVCFTTWHTTNTKEVEYRRGVKEDEEEGLNLMGSQMVVTCRVNGCDSISGPLLLPALDLPMLDGLLILLAARYTLAVLAHPRTLASSGCAGRHWMISLKHAWIPCVWRLEWSAQTGRTVPAVGSHAGDRVFN